MFNQTRLLVLFSLAVGVAIILFSNNSVEESENIITTKETNNANAFIEKAVITHYNDKGQPTVLESKTAKLYDQQIITISEPVMSLETKSGARLSATAENGTLLGGDETLDLYGDVQIRQLETGKAALTISADHLRIDNSARTLSTESKVVLSDGNNHLEAIGLDASLDSHSVTLKSNVKGSYVFQ